MAQIRDLPHLAGRLFDVPLCMDARKLEVVAAAFTRRMAGEPDDVGDSDAARAGDIVEYAGGIAIIQAFGSLVRRKNALQAYSGLTSYADLQVAFDAAVADNNVKAILLRLDSFGGEAGGCFELCERIFAARKVKPIWAVADIYALSGAYAIGCAAERLYVAPSGQVGSIGVVAVHCETSRMNDAMGVTYTVFRAGARKADLNPLEPLAAEASAKLQASMDKNRDKFAAMVARNRKIGKAAVMATEGAWYDADEAVSLKLVDGVLGFDEVLSQLFDKVSGAPERPSSADTAPVQVEPEVDPMVAARNAVLDADRARVAAVCELCVASGRSDMMIDFIEREVTVARAKAELAASSWDTEIAKVQERVHPTRAR